MKVKFVARLVLGLLVSVVGLAHAADEAKPRIQVEKATLTLEAFLGDENMAYLRQELPKAHGLFIVPQYLRAGFIFGGSGGSGVYLQRDRETGSWSYPAFYTMGGASVGFQAGADSAETIVVARTQRGAEMFLRRKFTVGPDVSVTAGPVGAGAKATIVADLVSFSRTKGAYGGLSVEGLVIQPRDSQMSAYYGKEGVGATDVLIKRAVSNEHADALRAAVAKATTSKPAK